MPQSSSIILDRVLYRCCCCCKRKGVHRVLEVGDERFDVEGVQVDAAQLVPVAEDDVRRAAVVDALAREVVRLQRVPVQAGALVLALGRSETIPAHPQRSDLMERHAHPPRQLVLSTKKSPNLTLSLNFIVNLVKKTRLKT